MGIQDRFRGQVVIGGVISKQTAHFSSSPLAAPTISFDGAVSTAAVAPQFVFTITANREGFGDTDGVALTRRATIFYHWEDTAGSLLDGAVLTGANTRNTSGLTAEGVVIPNSTVAGGYSVGRIVCSTAGICNVGFRGTSGGTSTGVLVLTLPNGLLAQSSQVALSS